MKELKDRRLTETGLFHNHTGEGNRLTFRGWEGAELIHSFWGKPNERSEIYRALKAGGTYPSVGTNNFPSRKIQSLRQVHSNRTLIVNGDTPADVNVQGHDAIFTDRKEIYIAITVADCLPIFVYDRKSQIAGLIHAGWRGTFMGIAARAIKRATQEFGLVAAQSEFVLGPCIQDCCFKVSTDVAILFPQEHVTMKNGSSFVDIPSVNRSQLVQAGARPERIHVSDECTFCNPEKFHSYRRTNDTKQKMIALMGLK